MPPAINTFPLFKRVAVCPERAWNGAVVNQNVDTWDAHNSIVDNHGRHAPEVDKPIAGLITDLKRRGLLDETLVLWHSEFGRMPLSQKGVGRDHNPNALTVWMAGAGIKGLNHRSD